MLGQPAVTNSANTQLVTAPAVISLSANYVMTPSDDQKVFFVSTPIVVTVPAMGAYPSVAFVFGGTGSVTVRPLAGVTINGASSDVLKNQTTDPAGFALTPLYGYANAYVTTSSAQSFGNLAGNASDNASLAAALALKADASVPPTVKLTANRTLQLSDHMGLFYTQASTSRTVIIPTGLPTYFRFFVGVLTGATADVIVGNQAGVTKISVNNAYRMTQINGIGEVRCTGDQDSYMLMPNAYWIV